MPTQDREDTVPQLPTTYTAFSGRTLLCEELTPEQRLAAENEVRRRVPDALSTFQSAKEALALDPMDEDNEQALYGAVEDLRNLLDVAEGLAWAPMVGEDIPV